MMTEDPSEEELTGGAREDEQENGVGRVHEGGCESGRSLPLNAPIRRRGGWKRNLTRQVMQRPGWNDSALADATKDELQRKWQSSEQRFRISARGGGGC